MKTPVEFYQTKELIDELAKRCKAFVLVYATETPRDPATDSIFVRWRGDYPRCYGLANMAADRMQSIGDQECPMEQEE